MAKHALDHLAEVFVELRHERLRIGALRHGGEAANVGKQHRAAAAHPAERLLELVRAVEHLAHEIVRDVALEHRAGAEFFEEGGEELLHEAERAAGVEHEQGRQHHRHRPPLRVNAKGEREPADVARREQRGAPPRMIDEAKHQSGEQTDEQDARDYHARRRIDHIGAVQRGGGGVQMHLGAEHVVGGGGAMHVLRPFSGRADQHHLVLENRAVAQIPAPGHGGEHLVNRDVGIGAGRSAETKTARRVRAGVGGRAGQRRQLRGERGLVVAELTKDVPRAPDHRVPVGEEIHETHHRERIVQRVEQRVGGPRRHGRETIHRKVKIARQHDLALVPRERGREGLVPASGRDEQHVEHHRARPGRDKFVQQHRPHLARPRVVAGEQRGAGRVLQLLGAKPILVVGLVDAEQHEALVLRRGRGAAQQGVLEHPLDAAQREKRAVRPAGVGQTPQARPHQRSPETQRKGEQTAAKNP